MRRLFIKRTKRLDFNILSVCAAIFLFCVPSVKSAKSLYLINFFFVFLKKTASAFVKKKKLDITLRVKGVKRMLKINVGNILM